MDNYLTPCRSSKSAFDNCPLEIISFTASHSILFINRKASLEAMMTVMYDVSAAREKKSIIPYITVVIHNRYAASHRIRWPTLVPY
jgi:hypothetical protein